MTYLEYLSSIRGKNVGFLGIGRSNMPLIRMLKHAGITVTARDKKKADELGDFGKELAALGVPVISGEEYLSGLGEHDILYKTPVIRADTEALVKAASGGTVITSEMELFFELCPCKIVAVTGSDGKTTTTTLIYEMLTAAGYTCHLGGNIGRPLIGDIEKIRPDDIAVVELSSFQLFSMTRSADIAVITNLSENHLDWHRDFAEYIDAKKNIFRHQSASGITVLNADNAYTAAMTGEVPGSARTFSLSGEATAYLSGEDLFCRGDFVMKKSDIRLPGLHNVANYLTAIAAVCDLVPPEVMKKVARTFPGVEHRIEFVRELDGVKYYNDSIGSSPARTKATLSAFSTPVVLIAGGYDKHLSYDELGDLIADRVSHLVLVGATSDKIDAAVHDRVPTTRCTSFRDAVVAAKCAAKPGDSVVLSPASASFDMFRDFEERGKAFKNIVADFKEDNA